MYKHTQPYNSLEAATVYADVNTKLPYFDEASKTWIIRYTVNGNWTWSSAKSSLEAKDIYNKESRRLRDEYLRILIQQENQIQRM